MGGIIAGFLGGAAKGMADAGKMLLADKLASERDEADFLRRSELRKLETGASQEFTTSERLSGQEYQSGENKKKLASQEKIAKDRAAAAAKPAVRSISTCKLIYYTGHFLQGHDTGDVTMFDGYPGHTEDD